MALNKILFNNQCLCINRFRADDQRADDPLITTQHIECIYLCAGNTNQAKRQNFLFVIFVWSAVNINIPERLSSQHK